MTHKTEDNCQRAVFIELSGTDSTNNYALNLLRQPNLTERQAAAGHGTAIFTHKQWRGKGQRGKSWMSAPGENLLLSLIIDPKPLLLPHLFALTAVVALVVRRFAEEKTGAPFTIKWPNDIYFQDRKAGGILIENIITGTNWKWAVAGIGLNVNQTVFDPALPNPVSLKQVSGRNADCLALAKELADTFFRIFDQMTDSSSSNFGSQISTLFSDYNTHLYRRGQPVKLKKGARVFNAIVKEVTPTGQLVTETGVEERFDFGEVSFMV